MFVRKPQLPNPDTLPFPACEVRKCNLCGLRKGCTAPVPSENVVPSTLMFVGQNPGVNEDLCGRPFVGAAGQYLNSLLFQSGIVRDGVCISNLVRCLSPNNRAPTSAEVQCCSPWLDLEIAIVDPRIIVTMGAPATHHFLGPDAGTMEHLHGRPVFRDGRVILPVYHPAAALHDTSKQRHVQEDFRVLRGLARGDDWSTFLVKDEFPNPDYRVADTPKREREMWNEVREAGLFAVDTEICRGRLWSAQFSTRPGTAWFLPIRDGRDKVDLRGKGATAVIHNYLFDIRYLEVEDDKFVDTMVMAYLTGAPQGLKELASRLCGVTMQNYRDVVRPGQQKLSLEYLSRVLGREWPDPPPIPETKWDNKRGELVTKIKKPWHISRKVTGILKDYNESGEQTDLWDRWRSIPAEEREVVSSVFGVMPESSLMDIPFEEAVRYSARDADTTIRVYYKLREMIQALDLDMVLDLDVGILPMVNSMMANGMGVDIDHFRQLSTDYDKLLREKATELARMVGHAFNPNSRPQVASVIYGELGFKPTAKTPTGDVSTDDQELKKTKSPVAKGIIQYRGIQKLKSTYADNVVASSRPDSSGFYRMHTVLRTTRVETGRLSSAKDTETGEGMNLQNIPTRSKEAKRIKSGFVAPPGRLLGELDYSQIEMVTLAHLSGCRQLIDVFRRGGDPHTEMAAKIFDIPLDTAAQSRYRRPVKCFHPDTEVLTRRGWAKITDLVSCPHVEVIQAIPGVDGHVDLEWAIPTDVFVGKHPSGRMIYLQNYGINLGVTPGHRMLAWQGCNRVTLQPRVVMPEELNKQRYWANAGQLAGGGVSVDERLLRLAVAAEADGAYSWRKIVFGFYNQRKIDRMRTLAAGEVTESTVSNGDAPPVTRMALSRELSDRVRALLDPDKSVPWWWLDLNPELRSAVLDELPNWDGGSYRKWTQYVYSSGNAKSRDVIQALAAVTGRKSRMEQKTSHSRGKLYARNNLYIRDHAVTRGGNLGICEEDYDGDVACLSVPSSYVLVRSGGIPVIVGNSLNFGIAYKIGPQGLANQIQEYIADLEFAGEPVDIEPWSVETCERFLADWYRLNPEVKEFQQAQALHARRYGYVRDLLGRIRYIPEISCPVRSVQEAGARQAANMPVTASAQEIIKAAMVKLWRDLPSTPWASETKYIMQIHDSLITEFPDDELFYRPLLQWMSNVMCNVISLVVPVKVDVKIGAKWGSLEKFKLERK